MHQRLLLAGLIVFFAFLLFVEPNTSWTVQSFLLRHTRAPASLQDIHVENDALKAQLAQCAQYAKEPDYSKEYKRAAVFSRYPFNFKSELTVAAGEESGIKTGSAATVSASNDSSARSVFVGVVTSVSSGHSAVKTVFDPSWRSAVRIGEKGVEAVLIGGIQPRLTLIPKSAPITPGDSIFSADERFPFGLAVGHVKDITVSGDQTSQEATVSFAYDINSLQFVYLIHI